MMKYLYLKREASEDDDFPWNKLTCLALVSYVIKKKHGSTHTISSLNQAAKEYLDAENQSRRLATHNQENANRMKNKMQTISQLFVNSLIPEAQIHFTVPEHDHLSDMDKNLKRNEVLAGFLDFLVQILYRESSVHDQQQYAPLQKALLFLLAVLGDKPFDCNTQHSVLEEQLSHLLVKSEALANEAGCFIYSCVFSVRLVEDEAFYSERKVLLEKFENLNAIIKQHCIKFSELPFQVVPQSNVVDSFFIVHSLVDDLNEYYSNEYFSLNDHIAVLYEELRSSQAVLKFIEAPQDDGPMKESLGQIRDLAYEAEYLINYHVVGNIHVWYLDLRLPYISQKIMDARERLQLMQPSPVKLRDGGEISYVSPAAAEDDNHFVELEHNTTGRILADLVGKTKSPRKTVLIFGMPGLGKTTIANKLYRCSSVSHYFDRRVWCVVSQTYSVRSLLITILMHLSRDLEEDEILKKSDAELGVDIHKSLKKRRYLIVLDDVWHCKVWYDLQRYLPDDGNGSRVIITSRIKDVAPDGSIYHELPLFSEDQCWDLLEKKLFLGESCPTELIKTGKGIAAKCSGIPLAVIITAGILANLEWEEDSWKRVEQQFDTFLLDGLSGYRKILELSYEHLPLNMKPCFLYFATFPQDSEISINKLAWSWIAEGFIRKMDGKSQEQIAESYLLELMNRSLVIPGKRRADGRTKTCRVHDLLHDICVMKANEENFLNSNNALSIYEKHQRSYLSSTSNTYSRPFGLHCRSFIGGLPDRSCSQTSALLKVLDIRPNKYQQYEAISFDLPSRLRYLGASHLTDQMVTNLDNLEFINIINSSQVKMPSIILRMKKLRHLIVKKEAMFENDGYVSRMTNLITLLHICIYKPEDEAILRDSPHLQKLKCNVGGKMIFPDLSFLEELETLKLDFKSYSSKRHKMVSNLNFPSTLRNLCLSNATMPWKKMSTIGRLPNLCVLKLETNAFVGVKWETLDGEFEELRFLKMELLNLKQWTSCSEHFPKLERLVVVNCWNLEEIPCDLGNISTLQRIDVERCLIQTSLSAVRIEQEQFEYGNRELLVNITAEYWTKEELVALYRENMGIAKKVSVLESDGNQMYELSSIICSPERDFLVRNNGEQVKVNSLKGKIIGIYFSAFWLESCQLFSPKLMKVYNELKKYGNFEIVFVSSYIDDEEESFNLNFSKLPWMAIPVTDTNARNKLGELFNVETLPHLVILDENGKVLTNDGVSIVEDGWDGYPFVPECLPNIKQLEGEQKELIKQPEEEEVEDNQNDSLEYLLVSKTRDYVINNDGKKIPVSSLVGNTILLFFGAHGYSVCQTFMQKLVKTYQEINEKINNSVEVIFISHDKDEFSFNKFFARMPWLGLPFEDDRTESLTCFYTVSFIPKLVVIGPTGKTVTDDGRTLIENLGAEAYPFTAQRLKEIEDKMFEFWPRKVRNKTHEHELVFLRNRAVVCDGCDDYGYYWIYRCEKCDFSLHPKCALGINYNIEMMESRPNKKMKEVPLIEDEEETSRNESLESLLVSQAQDYVIDSIGTKIPVFNLVGKTILLFFAGDHHSSRTFVPKLIKAYQEINEKYSNCVEVIFISDDENELTFEKFFVAMPWLALPFNDDRKKSLVRLYKVKTIPMVVVIGPTCKTVTVEGYKLISCFGADAYPFNSERMKEIEFENDMMAELWVKKVRNEVHKHELGLVKRMVPYYFCDGCNKIGCGWSYYCEDCDFDLHPKCAFGDDEKVEENRNNSLESLLVSDFADYVIDLARIQVRVSNLVGKSIILFFAAHWCPPCRFVLPELIKKYQENKEKHNNSVEVIFISLDKDKSSYEEFFSMMPWLALPFNDRRIQHLSRLFKVKATPMLVTIEPSGKIVEDKAWELISYPGKDTYPFTYEWVQSQTKAQRLVIFWPKKVTIKLHEHELCLVKQILYDCNRCHEVGFDWSYKCEVCVFSLHCNCALRDDKTEVKEELEDGEG